MTDQKIQVGAPSQLLKLMLGGVPTQVTLHDTGDDGYTIRAQHPTGGWTDFSADLANLPGAIASLLGTLKLVCDPATDGSTTATVSAAEEGAFTADVDIALKDSSDAAQTWYRGYVTLTPTIDATDTDIGVPTIVGGNTQLMVDGALTVTVVYDTDAGADKDYTDGDEVGFTCAVEPIFGAAVTGGSYVDTLTTPG